MADDNKVEFTLDLDVKSFTDGVAKATGVIEKLGSAESLAGLVEGLSTAAVALAAVGAAAYAFKEALNLEVEGEEIERVQKQFDTLAASAGISATALKDGMEKSASGLISTNDLLQIANKAIVTMGASADKLPQIMDVARKATAVFGGDFKSNFENISQAIENGNTRMLKHYGILVDSEAAVKKFAAANGLAANEISEAGKRQAILNEVLEQGQKHFKDVDENLGSTSNILAGLKTDFKEIGETIAVFFEQKLGPTIRAMLGGLKGVADGVKTYLQSTFGTGLTQSTAQLDLLKGKIKSVQDEIASYQNKGSFIDKIIPSYSASRVDGLKASLKTLESQLGTLQTKNTELSTIEQQAEQKRMAAGKADNDRAADSILKMDVHKANEKKFQDELLKIKKDRLAADQVAVNSFDQINKIIQQNDELFEKQHQQKISAIRANTALNTKQQDKLIFQEQQLYAAQRMQQEQKDNALRLTLMKNYQKNATTAFQGIARAFQTNSAKNKMELNNFGALGDQVFNDLQNSAVNAFQTMGQEMAKGGDIAAVAATAIRNVFLNAVADIAIQRGALSLASSIYPPNPLGIAAGIGLITLGGLIKGITGGGGSTTNVPSATVSTSAQDPSQGISTSNATSTASSATSDSSNSSSTADMQATPQKVVSVNIAGNYMDTDSTRRQMLEMIRQETDATDFSYNKVGA